MKEEPAEIHATQRQADLYFPEPRNRLLLQRKALPAAPFNIPDLGGNAVSETSETSE
jgi:hypothetical protein